MARYAIWDKKTEVYTPAGNRFTPAEWIKRYPIAEVTDIVLSGSFVNGAFFAIYEQFVEMYKNQGCDFSGCKTKQDHLDAIEAFEDEQAAASAQVATSSPEERIAAALEAQTMMAMDDVATA